MKPLLIIPLVLAVGPGAAPLASAADESSKPPKEILVDAAKAFASVKSAHLEGTFEVDGTAVRISGDATAGHASRLNLAIGRRKATLLTTKDNRAFIKANAAYLRALGMPNSTARKLAGRWVVDRDGRDSSRNLSPTESARCITEDLGTLSKSTATVAGRELIVITDKGDVPGGAPGRIYLTNEERPQIVRIVITGPARPGGTKSKCDDEEDEDVSGLDIRFSQLNKPVRITAPKHAIDPKKRDADNKPQTV